MACSLADALQRLDLSDAAFGALCRRRGSKKPIHRTQIWAYRTGRYVPRGDTASTILSALRDRGVEMTLDDLVRPAGGAAST